MDKQKDQTGGLIYKTWALYLLLYISNRNTSIVFETEKSFKRILASNMKAGASSLPLISSVSHH